ncbi:hypothetical protein ACFVU1_19370, partial [Streptomyces sp. NPDC057966]
ARPNGVGPGAAVWGCFVGPPPRGLRAGADPYPAERLTALLEGLSMRWLSGVLSLEHAQELMVEAIAVETGRMGSPLGVEACSGAVSGKFGEGCAPAASQSGRI